MASCGTCQDGQATVEHARRDHQRRRALREQPRHEVDGARGARVVQRPLQRGGEGHEHLLPQGGAEAPEGIGRGRSTSRWSVRASTYVENQAGARFGQIRLQAAPAVADSGPGQPRASAILGQSATRAPIARPNGPCFSTWASTSAPRACSHCTMARSPQMAAQCIGCCPSGPEARTWMVKRGEIGVVSLARRGSTATASRWDRSRWVASQECRGQPQAFRCSLAS